MTSQCKKKLQNLINIARYAPSAGNKQLVEWLVLTDKSKIKEIAGLAVNCFRQILKENITSSNAHYLPLIVAAWDAGYDAVLRSAPVLIIAHAPKEAIHGLVALSLALCYLDLVAPTLGLGTCWAGFLQVPLLFSPQLKQEVGIPRNYPHHYPMMLGYSRVNYYRLPERRTTKITWK